MATKNIMNIKKIYNTQKHTQNAKEQKIQGIFFWIKV